MWTLSVILGTMSVGVWVVAQLPQMIKNQTRRHAEDLSIHFLALWLAGDMSNLAGCLLVDAALTQTVLGVYFVLSDLILLGQWWYAAVAVVHCGTKCVHERSRSCPLFIA